MPKVDGFVKSPTSALRFISLSLRRTLSTPHDTKFARLEFGAFYFAIAILTFYKIVKVWFPANQTVWERVSVRMR